MIFGEKIYYNCLKTLVAFDKKNFIEALNFIDTHRDKGYFVGYVKYEAKNIFLNKDFISNSPLLYFEHFANSKVFDENFDKASNSNNEIFYPQISLSTTQAQYKEKIQSIKEQIANGQTYQVNFTHPLKIFSHCDEKSIFSSILKNQNTPYKAFMINEFESILSFSPELFFQTFLEDDKQSYSLITRPMKGTIERGKNDIEDEKNKIFLQNDPKNRSENVMIVDLLRNDLSKISLKKSVRVNKLFEIQTHSSLHQMVSEVQSKIPKNTSLYKIFSALFPCGSISGAPKIKTLEIIEELENYQRGIYCGAIGVVEKDKACFSVAIRTLCKPAKSTHYQLGVGGGITWDSKADEEFEESKLKSLFILPRIKFCLVETMKVQNCLILDFYQHLQRLKKTADYFGFKFDESLWNYKPDRDGILRILLNKNVKSNLSFLPLLPHPNNHITIHPFPIDSHNDFLYHKTTHRPHYQVSMDKVKKGLIFDEIFFNQRGELTEGTRSNLVLEINGKLLTPPSFCGLLEGIYRQNLINKNICEEKILTLQDLKKADKIYCVNSVRGMVETQIKTHKIL